MTTPSKAREALENTASWFDLDWKEGGRIASAVRDAQLDDIATLTRVLDAAEKVCGDDDFWWVELDDSGPDYAKPEAYARVAALRAALNGEDNATH